MPSTFYAIDPEWGESLIGLSWWTGYSSDNICFGKLAKFDPSGAARLLSPRSMTIWVASAASDTTLY